MLSNWNGWDIFPEKKHLSTSNRLTVISKKYLILNIFFVNIKFYRPFMSFLEASTDHQARKPPTHETIVCPICGKIFIKRDFWKFTSVTTPQNKKAISSQGDMSFPRMLIYQNTVTVTSLVPNVLAPRVIPLKPIAIMKKWQMKKYHIHCSKKEVLH